MKVKSGFIGNANIGKNGPLDAEAKLLPLPAIAFPGPAILMLEWTVPGTLEYLSFVST